jgi:intracellular sulfur oxidation DsrE/DsrF family protein
MALQQALSGELEPVRNAIGLRHKPLRRIKWLMLAFAPFVPGIAGQEYISGRDRRMHPTPYTSWVNDASPFVPTTDGGVSMQRRTLIQTILIAALAVLGTTTNLYAQTGNVAPPAGKQGVVIQVSDDGPKTWNQALNVIRNIQAAYGKDKVDIELVAFGNGIGILKADSTLANRIDDTLASGAHVYACENTMRGFKLSKDDMNPKIAYVPAGVIEIIEKQKAGWSVVRP